MTEKKYEKLTRDNIENTKIMAGHSQLTIEQLETEISSDSEIGKKLKTIERELEKY